MSKPDGPGLLKLIVELERVAPVEIEFRRKYTGSVELNLRSTEDRSLVRRMGFGCIADVEAWLAVEIRTLTTGG